MKKNDWFKIFGVADDKYVAEAHPDNKIKPKRSKALISLIAACACFALVFCNLWLFLPYDADPSSAVSKYKDSEYYGLIMKLNAMTYTPPKYKNNAEKLWDSLKKLTLNRLQKGDSAIPELGYDITEGVDMDLLTNSYKEITDNQVDGIIEADRIKRSDTHIYYLDDNVLRIFSIEKENTQEVGSYAFMKHSQSTEWEFYLSDDCKTVTIITQQTKPNKTSSERYVVLTSFDVSDPANIVKKEAFSITGDYISSRKANGSILLLTEFVMNLQEIDFDDETTFIPQIDDGDGNRSIPAGDIISPEALNSTRYTVAIKLDEGTLDIEGSAAYLSYSEDVYVSEEHVVLTHVFADKKENADGSYTQNSMTELSCLSYAGERFEIKGSAVVRGYVKDQWSMDEYDGILRVFTTTNEMTVKETIYNNGSVSADILQTATGNSNASLYCIDLTSFETVASVIDFAPPREEVRSVRFDKETAYVCTSVEFSDPVFFFDLSDLDNITFKDTGTINGFSTSLINIGGGYLLGIGRGGNWSSFKAEVYEETENGVRSVCSYELDDASYSTKYKSYYVDRENQLIGIGIKDNSYYDSSERSRYILLHFDGYELVELINVPLNGKPSNMRGVYIDGYMYMFGNEDFKVKKVFE